jgi:GABA permease
VLSIVVVVAILLVLLQMGLDAEVRIQLFLSLGAWVLVLVLYFATKGLRGRGPVEAVDQAPPSDSPATRVLVMANQTVNGHELLEELRAIDQQRSAEYFVIVPANPIDTGQAQHQGAVYMWEATTAAAQTRLDETLDSLRSADLTADGELGDYRPLRALAAAVEKFHPDRLVISTLPEDKSAWLRYDVVDRARETYDIPVTHVVVKSVPVSV